MMSDPSVAINTRIIFMQSMSSDALVDTSNIIALELFHKMPRRIFGL